MPTVQDIRRHGDGLTATAVASGDWDHADPGGPVVTELARLVGEGYIHLILDVRGVAFCDSACLGDLVGVYRLATERGGWLRLVAHRSVRRTLVLSGVDRIIAVYPTPDAAEVGRLDADSGRPT